MSTTGHGEARPANKKSLTRASVWTALSGLTLTVLPILAALISTRILMPADFGLIAYAGAMGAMLERFTNFGIDSALVQAKHLDKATLNTAWTFSFCKYVVIVFALLLAIPLFERGIGDPRIRFFIVLQCAAIFIATFFSNGIVVHRRTMNFRPLFLVDFFPISVYVAIVIAGLNYRASVFVLPIASIGKSLAYVVITRVYSPCHVWFGWSQEKFKQIFSFGACLLGNSIIKAVYDQGVNVVIGSLAGAAPLGVFDRGRSFSERLLVPGQFMLWRVAYPYLCRAHHNPADSGDALKRLTAIVFGVVPLGMTLYIAAAPQLIPLLLTERWVPVVPFVQLFSLKCLFLLLLSPAHIAFQSVGRPSVGTLCLAVEMMIFIMLAIPLAWRIGTIGVAVAALLGNVLIVPVVLFHFRRTVYRVSYWNVLCWVIPALLASSAAWMLYRVLMVDGRSMWNILGALFCAGSAYVVLYALVGTVTATGMMDQLRGVIALRRLNEGA